MILLQGAISAGAALLTLPLVLLAHIGGFLYFYGLVRPNYERYSTEQKALVWVAVIMLLSVAVFAIPLWSLLIGLASLSVSMVSRPVALLIILFAFLGVLFVVARLVYRQQYSSRYPAFSAKYFGYSLLISLGWLVAVLGLILFLIKDMPID